MSNGYSSLTFSGVVAFSANCDCSWAIVCRGEVYGKRDLNPNIGGERSSRGNRPSGGDDRERRDRRPRNDRGDRGGDGDRRRRK